MRGWQLEVLAAWWRVRCCLSVELICDIKKNANGNKFEMDDEWWHVRRAAGLGKTTQQRLLWVGVHLEGRQ